MNIIHKVYEIEARVDGIDSSISFISALAELLGIHPVAFYANIFPTVDKKGGVGLTATVSFVESYATIDSWPEENYLHLNIVSCKKFDKDKVREFIKEWFKVEEIKEYKVFDKSV